MPVVGVAALKLFILPDNMFPVLAILATDEADVLKQFIEFWWWFVGTIEDPRGFTVHGKVFCRGDGTLAQLLYEYDEYKLSVSVNGWTNCGPNPFLKSAAAMAFIWLRSRLRHLARRFLNQTCKSREKIFKLVFGELVKIIG